MREMAEIDSIQTEETSCPLCGVNDSLLLFSAKDRLHGLSGCFNVRQCRKCTFTYLSPRPSRQYIGHYYLSEYGPYQAPPSPHPRAIFWNQVQTHLWKRRLSELYAAPPPEGVLLELGCGNGAFLAHAQELGWRAIGIEMSEQAVSIARQQGLNVHCGTLGTTPLSTRFDLIRLSFVLEHLHDPLGTLSALRGLLEPTGCLHIAVPNIESFVAHVFKTYWYDLDVPRHLCWFTPMTLQEIARRAGLRVTMMLGEITPYVFWNSLHFRLQESLFANSALSFFTKWLGKGTAPLAFMLGWVLSRSLRTSRLHAIMVSDES